MTSGQHFARSIHFNALHACGQQRAAFIAGKFPDPNKFSLLSSADQIITTFDKIGTELTKLRIAQ
jgi:hypothetical protein